MNRKQAREFVMQTMFQIEVHKDFDNPDIAAYTAECSAGGQKEYIDNLLSFICGNKEEICKRQYQQMGNGKPQLLFSSA